MARISKKHLELRAIKNLAEAIAGTVMMTDYDIENLYKVNKKTALWNATAALLKMISELRN